MHSVAGFEPRSLFAGQQSIHLAGRRPSGRSDRAAGGRHGTSARTGPPNPGPRDHFPGSCGAPGVRAPTPTTSATAWGISGHRDVRRSGGECQAFGAGRTAPFAAARRFGRQAAGRPLPLCGSARTGGARAPARSPEGAAPVTTTSRPLRWGVAKNDGPPSDVLLGVPKKAHGVKTARCRRAFPGTLTGRERRRAVRGRAGTDTRTRSARPSSQAPWRA